MRFGAFPRDPARFDDLSARPRNHGSQVRRSQPVTFLWLRPMRGPKRDSTPWNGAAVCGPVDDQKWFESTDRDALPREAVHSDVRPDRFPKGCSPEPSAMPAHRTRITE
jgi:hypothetical protein